MPWHDDERALAGLATGERGDGTQRRTVQVVEVRVGDEHGVDGRQVAHAQAGTAETLEDEDPLGEVGVDDKVLATQLQEETGVANEGEAQLSASDELRFTGLAGARGEGRTADEGGNLSSFATNGDACHGYRLDATEGAGDAQEQWIVDSG